MPITAAAARKSPVREAASPLFFKRGENFEKIARGKFFKMPLYVAVQKLKFLDSFLNCTTGAARNAALSR